MDANKDYFPQSARIQIPAGETQSITLESPYPIVEYIELYACSSSFLNDAGVIVSTAEGQIYPAIGSKSDSNFATREQYGMIPPLGNGLTIPVNRKMHGNAQRVTLSFYNAGGSPLPVSILIVCSKERIPVMRIEVKDKQHENV